MNDLNPTTRIETSEEPFPSVTKRPVLTVLRGESLGLVLEIENERTTIGRGAQADLVLNDDVASRKHAEIVRSGAMSSSSGSGILVQPMGLSSMDFLSKRRSGLETEIRSR